MKGLTAAREGKLRTRFSPPFALMFLGLWFACPATALAQCVAFPAGYVPFTSVFYVSSPDAAGDELVVGTMTVANYGALSTIPLPNQVNQQFCGPVTLAPGLTVTAYVPTAAEKTGDFSAFSGLLMDPTTGPPETPFAGGIILPGSIPGVFAWRIPFAGPPVYMTIFRGPGPAFAGGQVIKVDGTTGSIGVVASPLLVPRTRPEAATVGPDGKLYVCDSIRNRILRMNQDGTQFEVIYDQTIAPGGPAGPEGPSFSLPSGDLYFNTRGTFPYLGVGTQDSTGVWKIAGVAAVPFGGPFPTPTNVIPAICAPSSTFCTNTTDGEGTAFDHNGNLLIVDFFNSRVLISPPPFTSISTLISNPPATFPGLSLPFGIAVNTQGDILVANAAPLGAPGWITCFDSTGAFKTVYYDFRPLNDFPLEMRLEPSGDLLVATGNLLAIAGELWRLSPSANPACSAPANATVVAGLAAAAINNTAPGLLLGPAVGVAIPNLTAPPQPIVAGAVTTVFASPTATHQIQYPADAVIPPGTTIQSTASVLTPSDFFSSRLTGSEVLTQFPNTKCIVYPDAPTTSSGNCFVFEDKCFDSAMMPTTCPTTAGFDPNAVPPVPHNSEDILIYTTINNLPTTPASLDPLPVNPGFLTATDGENDWFNIFIGMDVIPPPPALSPAAAAGGDPVVIRGGTSGFNSDFVAVDLGVDPSVGVGLFQGFQPPLTAKNGRVFSAGAAVPVKFRVNNAAGQSITNVTARLSVVLLGPAPIYPTVSPANHKGIAPDQFLYNSKSGSYEFYLNTAGYPAGDYSLTVFSNSFAAQVVTFTLQ